MYSKENDTVRTLKVNALFAETPLLKRVLAGKKKGNLNEDCLKSHSVPETGLFSMFLFVWSYSKSYAAIAAWLFHLSAPASKLASLPNKKAHTIVWVFVHRTGPGSNHIVESLKQINDFLI